MSLLKVKEPYLTGQDLTVGLRGEVRLEAASPLHIKNDDLMLEPKRRASSLFPRSCPEDATAFLYECSLQEVAKPRPRIGVAEDEKC